MAKVERVNQVTATLQKLVADGKKQDDSSVTVGYTQAYALFVHENLAAVHPIGQAKFLEQPARTMASELSQYIKNALKAKKTLSQALLLAGLKLQAASQKLVPVKTGALKGSAFTRLETK